MEIKSLTYSFNNKSLNFGKKFNKTPDSPTLIWNSDTVDIDFKAPKEIQRDIILGNEIQAIKKQIANAKESLAQLPSDDEKAEILKEEIERLNEEKLERKAELINRHFRFATFYSGNFSAPELTPKERIAAGVFGLYRATENWDPKKAKHATFPQFAKYYVGGEIRKNNSFCRYPVMYSPHVIQEISDFKKAAELLRLLFGREPYTHELMRMTGLSAKKASLLKRNQHPEKISFEELLESPGSFSQKIKTDFYEKMESSAEEEKVKRERIEFFKEALSTLPAENQYILMQRYSDEKHTYEEIGRALSMSGENARLLEKASLKQLRMLYDENFAEK